MQSGFLGKSIPTPVGVSVSEVLTEIFSVEAAKPIAAPSPARRDMETAILVPQTLRQHLPNLLPQCVHLQTPYVTS